MIGRLKRPTPATEFFVAVATATLAPTVQRLTAPTTIRPSPSAAVVAGQHYL